MKSPVGTKNVCEKNMNEPIVREHYKISTQCRTIYNENGEKVKAGSPYLKIETPAGNLIQYKEHLSELDENISELLSGKKVSIVRENVKCSVNKRVIYDLKSGIPVKEGTAYFLAETPGGKCLFDLEYLPQFQKDVATYFKDEKAVKKTK